MSHVAFGWNHFLSTVKMEAVGSSEMFMPIYQITRALGIGTLELGAKRLRHL
jgi:hypothetical protein